MVRKRDAREEGMSFPSHVDGVDVVGNGGDEPGMFQNAQNHQQPAQQTKPKALRFVTNYGAPHPKRRRIGAACLTCTRPYFAGHEFTGMLTQRRQKEEDCVLGRTANVRNL